MLLCAKIKIYIFHRDNSIPELLYFKLTTSCFSIVKTAIVSVGCFLRNTADRHLSADTINGAVKGADLICELSLISLLCTDLSTSSQTHICEETASCLGACVCMRFKCCTFYWPEEAEFLHAGETTCGGGSAIHSIYCSFLPASHFYSSVVWYHFTGSPDFPESQRGHVAHLLTFLPLELGEISPDIQLRLPAVILTSHETKSRRRFAI